MNTKDQGSLAGPGMDRRAFLGGVGALTAVLAGFRPAAALATATDDDRRVVEALTAALLPADRAQPAATQYDALLVTLDDAPRGQLLAGLGEVQAAMTPGATEATPAQIRSALRGWLPRSAVAPPEMTGDPAVIRANARRYAIEPTADPATWTQVQPCPFQGDPAYGRSLQLSDEQRRTARRVDLVVTLVDTLDGHATALAGRAVYDKYASCGGAIYG